MPVLDENWPSLIRHTACTTSKYKIRDEGAGPAGAIQIPINTGWVQACLKKLTPHDFQDWQSAFPLP